MPCKYCGGEIHPERLEIGLNYCYSPECLTQGQQDSLAEFRSEYTVGLLHKSNFVWVKKSDLRSLNVRPDLES